MPAFRRPGGSGPVAPSGAPVSGSPAVMPPGDVPLALPDPSEGHRPQPVTRGLRSAQAVLLVLAVLVTASAVVASLDPFGLGRPIDIAQQLLVAMGTIIAIRLAWNDPGAGARSLKWTAIAAVAAAEAGNHLARALDDQPTPAVGRILLFGAAVLIAGPLVRAFLAGMPRSKRGQALLDGLMVVGATGCVLTPVWYGLAEGQDPGALVHPEVVAAVIAIAGPMAGFLALIDRRLPAGTWGAWASLIGVLVGGLAWIGSLRLHEVAPVASPGPLGAVFSVSMLLVAWGTITWRRVPQPRPGYGRRSQAIVDTFPLVAVAAALAVALPAHGRADEVTVQAFAAGVVALALVRQLLLVNQERQAGARELRAADRLAREVRQRAEMVGWLASFESGTTPESTAAQICERMTGIGGVAEAVVLAFEADGTSTILAEAGPARPGAMVGNTQSSELTAHFRKRAGEGPWIEAIADRSDPHALVLQAAGLEWVANAPIRFGSELVGRLSISTVGGADPELQAERLATAADLGVLTGAILGGPLAERARLQASRDEIGRIIEGWAFRTVFQPIVDLGTRRVVGHEALTRFEDGMRPDHRFAEADRVGLGAALEVATLESAIRSSVRLPSDTYVSLNASPDLATDIVTVEALVSRVACPVVLEITEHAAIEDYRQLRTALERIRKHVRIAVDDVGAGYAGLRHILELGPDLLKLDIGLVRSVDQDVAKRALINGIIAFARDVGCKIVAEGIETREEERVLADMGVALGQGYLFGKPARIDQIAVDGWVGTAAGRG